MESNLTGAFAAGQVDHLERPLESPALAAPAGYLEWPQFARRGARAAWKQFAHPDQLQKTAANLNGALASTLVVAGNEYMDIADVETSFGELPAVTCQLGELNQTFPNILVNASHAMAEVEATRPRGLLRVTTRQDHNEAVVEISDTGGGIPVEVRERIFDPFFTTKAVGKGTGQGLAMAHRSVVEGHGGSLTFTTTIGRGNYVRDPHTY